MGRPSGDNLFPRVRAAREALKEKALELFDKHMKLIDLAMAAGDYETAEKALEFLSSHMPKDPDGTSFLDQSVDKVEKKDKPSSLPSINIGFALGGIRKPVELPIDVTPDEPE
jgi:hypothetical protein